MSENIDNEAQQEPTGVDPKAFDRVKNELGQTKQKLAGAESVLASALLVDKLYEHFAGKEGITDPYRIAKEAAAYPGIGEAEDPAEAADAWLNRLSGLLASPKPTEDAPKPVPPMAAASGPNPAATGTQIETGPFKVGSDQYKKYVQENGMAAAYKAIQDGQFFFSAENDAAQKTAALY